jgi:hypothetical protein
MIRGNGLWAEHKDNRQIMIFSMAMWLYYSNLTLHEGR